MKVHSTKTDNASVPDKVFLRKKATAGVDTLRVLDLYAGENVLWGHFETKKYFGVEIVKGKGKNLNGDCRRVIESLDLSDFNVIDCDSYGIPFDVITKIFQNKTLRKGTVVIYTAISNKLSGLNSQCLEMFNLKRLFKKCPTLVSAKSFELFYAMLEKYGVSEVYYYKNFGNFEKHYGYFVI